MLKKITFLLLLVICIQLIAQESRVDNLSLELSRNSGYSVLQGGTETIYQQEAGAPAIPQLGVFVELTAGSEVRSIEVIPQEIETLKLDKPLLPVQQAVPYSQEAGKFIEPRMEYYSRSVYPADWLNTYAQGNCGEHTILSITINALQYEPGSRTAYIPTSFDINIETSSGDLPEFSDNLAVAKVLETLGIDRPTVRENTGYLAIAPLMFQNSLMPLLDWRREQGYDVYFRTTEEISTDYEGEDLPAKIRSCISDMQQTYGISYVTLAADHQYIPARFAFAFDCAYGAHEGENDLASDMYYSCLDGNWNADADTLYGEDEDEVDLYPEVFVGRIPANTAGEMTAYISKLLQYERGTIADYNRAGGLSMELWDGSTSEQCQQYIYDQYFPDNYEINFIYGDDNNEANAFAMLSDGQNIVQHTGHAWINVLSLENYGHIYSTNVAGLTNDWGGMFYSIGCWSNAFDSESIGETFVREQDRCFLGYIGNSSYGWGSPSAAQFGFSEFYQKEFFRLLFHGDENTKALGAVQALQKLAFIPYYEGISIYKWVGYELNLCGDAAAMLYTNNPPELNISASHTAEEIYIQVKDENNESLSGAVITFSEQQWITDSDGLAILPWVSETEENYQIYARGYQQYPLVMEEVQTQPVLDVSEIPELMVLETEYELGLEIINPGEESLSFRILATSQPDDIEIIYDPEIVYTVAGGDSQTLDTVTIRLDSAPNFANGTTFGLELQLIDLDENLITAAEVNLQLQTADLTLQMVDWQEDVLIAGATIPVSLTFGNQVDISEIDSFELEITGDEMEMFNFSPSIISVDINELSASESVSVTSNLAINPDLPEDYYGTILIELAIGWEGDKSWHKTYAFVIGNGNLQLSEDFENGISWDGDDQWQENSTYAYNGINSLSCRPAEVGNYLLTTPVLTWAPGTEVSFWYRGKMPMYGGDGFFLRLLTGEEEQVIIFLGSGGALNTDTGRPMPEVYIETEWVHYQFDLEDLLINPPEAGDNYQL
ncbi:MAG: C25 family cysteine peptidase, partial [Candidatus Stygibacter frigidus]|nr:C25 family cysteine peptidase [Candidatus Stygibacter frigidus]